ncbi:MAG: homogentisate 1,2-dioxygenase [Persicimonas sp.]
MYFKKGRITRQAHVDLPEGTVEEEYAREGFFGRTAHLYRTDAPVGWVDIEGDLRPHAFDTAELPGLGGDDYLSGRVPFLRNDDCALSMARVTEAMAYDFRNADGDETLFVHGGEGRIETDFGPLDYEQGDYLVIPKGTSYRLVPQSATSLLIIETTGAIGLPDRGIIGQHALFDPGVINVPEPAARDRDGDRFQLKIKHSDKLTTLTYPHDPMNVVGWKGDLTVWQLNVRDIRPITSESYHLPPTAHVTFTAPNVLISTFLPRPLETGDPGALRVPFYHANIDYDEVLFYHDGEFFSREGIDAGMVTFHPQGLPHGPHPKAIEAAETKERTNEKAVMIDTRNPLEMTSASSDVERKDYWKSWM